MSPKGVYIRRHENLRGAVDNDERTRAILGADITGTLMRLAECGGLGSDEVGVASVKGKGSR